MLLFVVVFYIFDVVLLWVECVGGSDNNSEIVTLDTRCCVDSVQDMRLSPPSPTACHPALISDDYC